MHILILLDTYGFVRRRPPGTRAPCALQLQRRGGRYHWKRYRRHRHRIRAFVVRRSARRVVHEKVQRTCTFSFGILEK